MSEVLQEFHALRDPASLEDGSSEQSSDAAGHLAPVRASLPDGLGFLEQAAGRLRDHLRHLGLARYTIFQTTDADWWDLEQLPDLQGPAPAARWEPLLALSGGGAQAVGLTHLHGQMRSKPAGVLHLRRFGVVMARWLCVEERGKVSELVLMAADSADAVKRLRTALTRHRRQEGAPIWQVLKNAYAIEQIPRALSLPEPMLPEAIRQRVQVDMLAFFDDSIAALYRSMGLAHRRGVLLHGPPGNGKTSLIKYVGGALPRVPMLLLRPCAGFDVDDLEDALRRWTRQAPAVLVVEDLDSLLKNLEVSAFLNALDGIDSPGGGLLLIATTNHPQKLDPALNNRPAASMC